MLVTSNLNVADLRSAIWVLHSSTDIAVNIYVDVLLTVLLKSSMRSWSNLIDVIEFVTETLLNDLIFNYFTVLLYIVSNWRLESLLQPSHYCLLTCTAFVFITYIWIHSVHGLIYTFSALLLQAEIRNTATDANEIRPRPKPRRRRRRGRGRRCWWWRWIRWRRNATRFLSNGAIVTCGLCLRHRTSFILIQLYQLFLLERLKEM